MSIYKDDILNNKKEASSNIKTEVLFKNNGESLSYIEPKKLNSTNEILVEKANGLYEENISFIEPNSSKDTELKTEVLFKSGIEEIEVNDEIKLSEESLTFSEPIKPDYVTEEVLFKNEKTENINYSLFDNDISLEDTLNELVISDESQFDSSELNKPLFSDIQSNLLNVSENINITNQATKVIKKNFAEKMFLADSVIMDNYCELKNILLSYKKMKSRISNTADTFNIGRTKLAKLSVSGKSLKLYLNLDYNEVESRLKCRDASNTKAYE